MKILFVDIGGGTTGAQGASAPPKIIGELLAVSYVVPMRMRRY